MNWKVMILIVLSMVVLPACSPPTQPTSLPTLQPTPGYDSSTEPPASPLSPLPAQLWGPSEAAAEFLAAELGMLPEMIALTSSSPAEWPDTGLGCPEPGTMYAQVVTPGYIVLMQVDGTMYEVHTDQTGQNLVTCSPSQR